MTIGQTATLDFDSILLCIVSKMWNDLVFFFLAVQSDLSGGLWVAQASEERRPSTAMAGRCMLKLGREDDPIDNTRRSMGEVVGEGGREGEEGELSIYNDTSIRPLHPEVWIYGPPLATEPATLLACNDRLGVI